MGLWNWAWILFMAASGLLHRAADGVRPAYYNLNDHCADRIITLPCQTGQAGRVGTMEFSTRPSTASCRVKISLSDASCESFNRYFIYFNVKSVSLLEEDTIEFHEQYRYQFNSTSTPPLDSTFLLQTLPKNLTCNEGLPTSCDQLLTNDFSLDAEMRVTALTVTYVASSTSRQVSVKPLVMDYVVLTGSENGDDIWCPSLKGFVPRKQMCDASDDADRVVCPSYPFNATTQEIDSMAESDNHVVSTLQGSQWNSECRLISIELLIGIVFMFIAAVVLVVIFLIIGQYYRKIWKSKKLVYSGGRISFGNNSATSSTVAFENLAYAPDSITDAFHDAGHLTGTTLRTQPLPPLTSPSTVNILTVARSPAGSLFTIQEEMSMGVTEA